MPRSKTKPKEEPIADQVTRTELRLGLKLPETLRRLFLHPQFHHYRTDLIDDGPIRLSRPSEVVEWSGEGLVERSNLPTRWRKCKFLKFGTTCFGDDLLLCISAGESKYGVVLVTDHEGDENVLVLGDDLAQWLRRLAEFNGVELAVVPGNRETFSRDQQLAFARDHLRLNPNCKWSAEFIHRYEHPGDMRISYWDAQNEKMRPISELTWLTSVDLVNLKPADLNELSGLKRVSQLLLSNCICKNWSALGKLKKLEWLGIYDCPPTDVARLATLRKLKQLRTLRTIITNVGCLSRINSLEFVEITEVPFDDVEAVAAIPSLRRVSLPGTNIATIEPLIALQSLEYLQIDDTPVKDLSPCKNMPGLRKLIISKKLAKSRILAALKADCPLLKIAVW